MDDYVESVWLHDDKVIYEQWIEGNTGYNESTEYGRPERIWKELMPLLPPGKVV